MRFCPVSVVIPTYNRAKFLERAIFSVEKQTVRCLEIIVVDDGSTDNSADILKNLQLSLSTQIKIYNGVNKGPAAARNYGIEKTSGEYIAFLDSDDHWNKKKIAMQYDALCKNPQFSISHTKERWLRRGEHLNQKKIHIPRHGDIFDHCLQLCGVGMSTVMLKKDVFTTVGQFDETLRCCEDYDLWLRVSSIYDFLLIDEPLTVKEGGRDDQVSHQYRVGMDKLRIYAIKKILDRVQLDDQNYILALKEIVKKSRIYGNGCLKHGNNEDGNYYLELAKTHIKLLQKKEEKMSLVPYF